MVQCTGMTKRGGQCRLIASRPARGSLYDVKTRCHHHVNQPDADAQQVLPPPPPPPPAPEAKASQPPPPPPLQPVSNESHSVSVTRVPTMHPPTLSVPLCHGMTAKGPCTMNATHPAVGSSSTTLTRCFNHRDQSTAELRSPVSRQSHPLSQTATSHQSSAGRLAINILDAVDEGIHDIELPYVRELTSAIATLQQRLERSQQAIALLTRTLQPLLNTERANRLTLRIRSLIDDTPNCAVSHGNV